MRWSLGRWRAHRMGFARLAENSIRNVRGKRDHESLGALDKIAAASIGGALATWNQPIEGELEGCLDSPENSATC